MPRCWVVRITLKLRDSQQVKESIDSNLIRATAERLPKAGTTAGMARPRPWTWPSLEDPWAWGFCISDELRAVRNTIPMSSGRTTGGVRSAGDVWAGQDRTGQWASRGSSRSTMASGHSARILGTYYYGFSTRSLLNCRSIVPRLARCRFGRQRTSAEICICMLY